MGKSKLGRVRKYANRVYQRPFESATHDTATATATPNADLLGHLPYQFLFSLRNVAPAVLHQPSICNYSRVFTILSSEGVFRNQWNLIKHSELFLMLCTFSTRGITPVPERTVVVNTDLTWRVIAFFFFFFLFFLFLHRLLIVYIFYKLYILYCINCIHCF